MLLLLLLSSLLQSPYRVALALMLLVLLEICLLLLLLFLPIMLLLLLLLFAKPLILLLPLQHQVPLKVRFFAATAEKVLERNNTKKQRKTIVQFQTIVTRYMRTW